MFDINNTSNLIICKYLYNFLIKTSAFKKKFNINTFTHLILLSDYLRDDRY